MNRWIGLSAGSVAGGLARYAVAGSIYDRFGAQFPHGTLAVNVSACLLIGLFNAAAEGRLFLSPETRVLLMTGFCGAYSTFSTLILETSNLLRDGEWLLASYNIAASLILGLAAFKLGEAAGKLI